MLALFRVFPRHRHLATAGSKTQPKADLWQTLATWLDRCNGQPTRLRSWTALFKSLLWFQLRNSCEGTTHLGCNDTGIKCGKKKGKVAMGREHYQPKIHPIHRQAMLYSQPIGSGYTVLFLLRVVKDCEARPDCCENRRCQCLREIS